MSTAIRVELVHGGQVVHSHQLKCDAPLQMQINTTLKPGETLEIPQLADPKLEMAYLSSSHPVEATDGIKMVLIQHHSFHKSSESGGRLFDGSGGEIEISNPTEEDVSIYVLCLLNR
jgi:hypothetical protein